MAEPALSGPRGTKPKRTLSTRNIVLYGILGLVALYYVLPLWVMIMTSLKGMPEVRLGNIFAPPVEITFEPWVKAWATACTGLNCEGLSRGFWNSVIITVPSVILSIVIASVNGYALINWKFKGSEVVLHNPDLRVVHPLSDHAVSDRDPLAGNGPLRVARD